MDRIAPMEKITEFARRYRYVILVLLIGIGLMLLPSEKERVTHPEETTVNSSESGSEEKLSQILSKIDGVGKTEVLLTIAAGEEIYYQCNEYESTGTDTGTIHREVVIVTDAERREQGLVQQVIPPKYQGAIVVCQGADRATVRLQIVEAVANVTGLTADKITVLKMK